MKLAVRLYKQLRLLILIAELLIIKVIMQG